MTNLFSKNGFNVLGLDSSASQKDINRRAKELSNLLKIEQVPEYDQDLPLLKIDRDANSVKTALQNLTSPTKKIKEYFFWFDIENADNSAAFDKLANKQTADVIAEWHEAADSETAKGYIAKRNLAVLLSILVGSGTKQYLSRSLRTWQELTESERFWSSFTKIYQLNDELGTSSDAISDFRSGVINLLADYYADVSKSVGDNSYVSEFQRVFKVKGARVEKDLLGPIYATINDASSKLIKMKIDDENMISKQRLAELKGIVVTLRNSFDKLKDIGLYNDSQSKTMRDKAAEAMRSVALDLYNNLNDAGKSGSILKIAVEICGTPTLKSRLEDDLNDLRRLVSRDKIILPINALLEAEDFEAALQHIEEAQGSNKANTDLQAILVQRLKWCITGISGSRLKQGKELYDKNKYNQSLTLLAKNVEFILSYLEYTDINREYVDNVISEINRLTSNLGKDQNSGTAVDNLRNGVVEQSEEHFKDQFEGSLLIILIDSALYANLAEKIPALKRKKQVKGWVTTAITIIVLIIIGAASSGNSNNSGSAGTGSSTGSGTGSGTSSAAYTDCVNQYNSLKSQLDSINSQEDSYKAAGNTDSYNALVPQQNDLVNQLNSKATECNGLR